MSIPSLFQKSFFTAAIGSILEYYDYFLLIAFFPIIAPLFFPSDLMHQSLIKGYVILLLTIPARPLGGLIFGYWGDYFGRRIALLGSLLGSAIATITIGLTPSYAIIGIWGGVIITIAKIVQLFCFGGEFNGAGIYVVEHVRNKNEGFFGALLTSLTLVGGLVASILALLLTLDFIPHGGWRVAFILGGIFGIVGIFYRKNLLESPDFKPINSRRFGLLQLIKSYPKEILSGVFIGGFSTTPFSTLVMFINPLLMEKGYFSTHQLMIIQSLIILFAIIFLIIGGKIADKTSPSKTMQWGAFLLILFSYPLFKGMNQQSLYWILFSEFVLIGLSQFVLGPSHAYFKNAFDMHYRYRGSSLSFGFGMSIFGSLSPVVAHYLYQWSGDFSSISLWFIFVGTGTALSMWLAKSKSARIQLASS